MANTTADLILLVDDDATGRSIRKAILEMHGHRVADAGEAQLALRTLASEPVRLVILDYFLNDTTGVALAKEMRQVKPEVPILLLSASGDVPEGTEYADAYLSKMEPVAVVEEKILALLRQGRQQAP